MSVPNWIKWLAVIILVYLFLTNPQELVALGTQIGHSIGVIFSSFHN